VLLFFFAFSFLEPGSFLILIAYSKIRQDRIFLKKVYEANRFGVAELDGDRVIGIEEKPENTDVNNYILVKDIWGIKC
jgi:dTDP-glucose pyrophosphorylase